MSGFIINQIDIFHIDIENFYICAQKRYRDMKTNLNTLRYIVAVDTYRNFVKAAESCGVTQPTLSTAIRNMEMELDVTIFDRGAHPVRPTAIGERIITLARLTLQNASQIEEMVRSERGEESGKAVLGIIPTIAPYILPGLFKQIHSQHPSIHLQVSEMRTKYIIEKLLAAEIDMAILATPLEQKDLLEIPLYYERFAAYISPEDELYSLSEIPSDRLASDRLWILEEGHCLRKQVFNFCHSHKTHHEYQAGSIDNLIRVVDANGGYTVIPELHIPTLTDAQRANIRPIVGSVPSQPVPSSPTGASCQTCIPVREVSLVIREDFVRERLLNIIADCIKQIIPAHMLDDRLKRFAIKL